MVVEVSTHSEWGSACRIIYNRGVRQSPWEVWRNGMGVGGSGAELENVEKREWREEGCVEQSGYGAASMVVS